MERKANEACVNNQDIPLHDEMLAPMVKFFKKFKLASAKL